MRRVVVVGGSIAGVTAAGGLRAEGWDGELTVVSAEAGRPYSRVPLSKGILAGTEPVGSAYLPPLPEDVAFVPCESAIALDPARRRVRFAGGLELPYDGLVLATGARARRLAGPGQRGEHVVRTLGDAEQIAARLPGTRTAVVVGAGFLGMEVASTLCAHGIAVTVVYLDPPQEALVGPWLARLLRRRAEARGVRFVHAANGARLLGNPVCAVDVGAHERIEADLVVSAIGDVPNSEWLRSSGLPLASGGVVVDGGCTVSPRIVAAGDVATRALAKGGYRRTPNWTNAVVQGRSAARRLLDPGAPPYQADDYFWTEQFGLDVKLVGAVPHDGEPEVLDGDPGAGSALLEWNRDGRRTTAVALNYRMPVSRLKAMVRPSRVVP